MSISIPQINAVVEQGRVLAEAVMNCDIKFFERGNPTPVLTCPGRVKKPRPAVFDAIDPTEWNTKRRLIIQIPRDVNLTASDGVVEKGWVVQISGADDPTVNNINFTVESALNGGYAYARNIAVVSDVIATPRVVEPAPPEPTP